MSCYGLQFYIQWGQTRSGIHLIFYAPFALWEGKLVGKKINGATAVIWFGPILLTTETVDDEGHTAW